MHGIVKSKRNLKNRLRSKSYILRMLYRTVYSRLPSSKHQFDLVVGKEYLLANKQNVKLERIVCNPGVEIKKGWFGNIKSTVTYELSVVISYNSPTQGASSLNMDDFLRNLDAVQNYADEAAKIISATLADETLKNQE